MATTTQAKYHHLIPRTYMSAWANQSGTLKVEFLNNPGVLEPRNKDNIAGFTDYHSIKAGMPICTQSDTDIIFSVLTDYNVIIDGQIVTDTRKMNESFYDFDNWIITRKNGTLARKKPLKDEIQKVKIKDIEANWSVKYENKWGETVSEIENIILNTTKPEIPSFSKDYLMKFFVALDWRGFQSNKQFEEAYKRITQGFLDQVIIPEDERELPFLETIADEFRHDLLLKYYRLFLEDNGIIYEYAETCLKKTGFHFFVADGPTYFDTCDSPSFVFTRPDRAFQGIMPITPRILLSQGKCTDDSNVYQVTHISNQAVEKYNRIIQSHATEFVIHPNN